MQIASFDSAGRPVILFPIFYDVPQHAIAIETFVTSALEFSKIVESFNQDLFEGQLQYRIYVLPPEAGSFAQRLGVVVITGAVFVGGSIFGASIGDLGKGFVEGVVGQPLQQWGQELGHNARSAVEDWFENTPEKITTTEDASEFESQIVAGGALTSLSRNFLSQPTRSLRETGIEIDDFPDLFEAKNRFFESIELNAQVSGIGFEDVPEFPIRRDEFQRRVTPVRREEEEKWTFEAVRLFVTSPNWDRADRQRGWKGRDGCGLISYFHIYDPLFWRRFDDGRINSQNIDEIIGQAAYRMQNGRRKNCVILNVISYNDENYAPEINNKELKQRLEDHLNRSIFDTRQDGLF
ncbi:hypothetical protein KUL25_15245 [Rhodobacteraceae bacterium N5(2021)]|uniref:Uncharacterized protein n=1 Tax=Gymnodinialimonas phycosphaerae TaxID=2841589 RepID=A0A975TU44_9RHOB|nr:hypothetical protein [Gymnodinialimonas phycosphaerae]MBY4894111.1 hypothetical protein [Gymnodinialimonas phycosphaerae]